MSSESAIRPTRPRVSIVIPAFNARPLIDDQLAALSQQTYTPVEIIVSDNGSTDGLVEHIAGHPLRETLNLVYLDSSGQQGAAYARNAAVEVARGEFIAFCDADDVMKPTWLERIIELAPAYDLVGTACEAESLNDGKVGIPVPPPSEQGRTRNYRFAGGGSLGIWRECYLALRGMNTAFASCEDVEFTIRAQKHGYTLGSVQDPMFAYRLKTRVREVWRQGLAQGRASVQLTDAFGPDDFPTMDRKAWAQRVVYLMVTNPAVPRQLSGISAREWVAQVGFTVGRARAGSPAPKRPSLRPKLGLRRQQA